MHLQRTFHQKSRACMQRRSKFVQRKSFRGWTVCDGTINHYYTGKGPDAFITDPVVKPGRELLQARVFTAGRKHVPVTIMQQLVGRTRRNRRDFFVSFLLKQNFPNGTFLSRTKNSIRRKQPISLGIWMDWTFWARVEFSRRNNISYARMMICEHSGGMKLMALVKRPEKTIHPSNQTDHPWPILVTYDQNGTVILL